MARLAPMRLITLAARVSMLVVGSSVVWLVVLALARWQRDGFTAAELAGRAWSGRARDAQEDIHNVGPAPRLRWWATQAGSFGYVWAFAAVAVFPALARADTGRGGASRELQYRSSSGSAAHPSRNHHIMAQMP